MNVSKKENDGLNTTFFWEMIDLAWMKAECFGARDGGLRESILAGSVPASDAEMAPFCKALEAVLLTDLKAPAFAKFAETWDRMVFELDREVLADHIGLGDDGFGDARSTVVALGKAHFEAVLADPKAALVGGACERLSYLVDETYEARLGRPRGRSGWDTSTGSNLAHWPAKRAKVEAKARVTRAADDLWNQLGLKPGATASATVIGLVGHVTQSQMEDAILQVAQRIQRGRSAARG